MTKASHTGCTKVKMLFLRYWLRRFCDLLGILTHYYFWTPCPILYIKIAENILSPFIEKASKKNEK